MPEGKFLKISSDDPLDINDLFEAICHDVLKLPSTVVKKRAMGFIGKDRVIGNQQPSLMQVLKLCKDMSIPYEFSLKLSYQDSELTIDERKSANRFRDPDFREGYRERDLDKKLEEQANQLTNPELKALERNEKRNEINREYSRNTKVSKEIGFRPDEIPDFPT